jgi:NAD(P)-dependent dehydrogenase (short-subunit alcohol dehydrogenase family)
MNLKDTPVIVTGGASGLGAATARLLSRSGARVAILDVNISEAEKMASEIQALAFGCDVTDEKSALWAIDKAREAIGPARVLVNCAGIGTSGRIVGREGPLSLEVFEKVIKVNLIGSFNMMRLAAAGMMSFEVAGEEERGVIVSTASVAAFEGQVGQAAYAASKGGIVSLTLPAARELSQFGIRVNAIAPGLFLTPLLDGLSDEARSNLSGSIPFPRRLGMPQEFASLVLHVIENRYINGEVIRIDGALRMQPR